MRHLTALDRLVAALDAGLRASTGQVTEGVRPNPAGDTPEMPYDADGVRMVARLVRVDHAGEVAAQGLYEGQALTARNRTLAGELREAAREEADHLAWCSQRLDELGAEPSRLAPLWYFGSFTIGAVAGALGDRWSLGFVVETERQVQRQLDDHLDRIPLDDGRTRAILGRMREDEARHATNAYQAGGQELPGPIRRAMHAVSRVMTVGAYWM